MRRGQQVSITLSLLFLGQIHGAPKPFLPFVPSPGEALEFIGGLFNSAEVDSESSDDSASYDAAPETEEEEIPCSRRRKRDDSYGAPQVDDPCGVFQETDSFVPTTPTPAPATDGGDAAAQGTNCKWVQATTFKVKYHTECEDVTSSQCVMSYKTACKDSVSYECRTEYNEECSTAQVEECTDSEPQTSQVEECNTTVNKVTETVTEEVCTLKYEDVCTNSYGLTLNCIQVPKKTCENVDKTIEKDVPVQTCDTVTKTSEPQQSCVTVQKQTCNSIPTETCANVPRSDCSLVATGEDCKKLPERQCKQKPIQYPITERKKVCDGP